MSVAIAVPSNTLSLLAQQIDAVDRNKFSVERRGVEEVVAHAKCACRRQAPVHPTQGSREAMKERRERRGGQKRTGEQRGRVDACEEAESETRGESA